MIPPISLSYWIETLLLAALAVLLVFGLVGVLVTRLRSARGQRLLWLGGFATLGLFLLGIGAGADRWMTSRETAIDGGERVFVVRGNLPAGETTLPQAQSTAETLAHATSVSDVKADGWCDRLGQTIHGRVATGVRDPGAARAREPAARFWRCRTAGTCEHTSSA